MFPLASFTLVSILGTVSAARVQIRQSTCSPNFEGAGVSIVAGDTEWGVSSLVPGTQLKKELYKYRPNTTADWHVQQTGESPPRYTVREINHNELGVGIASSLLAMVKTNPSDASQLWEITCAHCLPGASSSPHGGMFAAGCSIKSVPNNLCAEVERDGDAFFLEECNPVVAQTYDFWTATGLETAGSTSPSKPATGTGAVSTPSSNTCSPNFEGAGVSIVAGGVEWGVSSLDPNTKLKKDLYKYKPNTTADWHVQQTGESPPRYTVREINHDELAVGLVSNELTMVKTNPSDASQLWEITCAHCLPGASSSPHGGMFAAGCSIKSAPNNLCAEVEQGGEGFFLTGCNPVIAQTYDFWTAMGLDSAAASTSAAGSTSAPKAAGNLFESALSGTDSDTTSDSSSSKQWTIAIGLLATNLVLLIVLVVFGVLSCVRQGNIASASQKRYAPEKVREMFLAPSHLPYSDI
ncbi:hypothetical protein FB451DRAFT_1366939 [Mycena latifolia]|nr:hypothetical protein FB451DRAFT_1366939 [Mycena latifolia]